MANEKGMASSEEPIIGVPNGKNYLLVIANDDYPDKPLRNCIRDAEAFVEVLTTRYSFENQYVMFLKNADRKTTLDAFKQQVTTITPQDNLIIYYSGHGAYDKDLDEGAWVPSGATFADTDDFISNADLKVRLSAIHSHHTFFISDSCYSGALFLSAATRSGENFLEKFPSRWGLASGRIQTVSDGASGGHSPFAEALLNHLKHNDTALSVMDLCIRVVQQVGANEEGQMPIGEPLHVKGHQAGQFIFHLKEEKEKKTFTPKPKPQGEISRGEEEESTLDSLRAAETSETKIPFQYDKAMDYFTQNNTNAVFRLIDEYLAANKDTTAENTAAMLKAEYNKLKKEEMLGTQSYQEHSLTRNQINSRLLGFLGNL
jgi:Caspase domain/Effector-associated domain 11